jgi:hypothetical protein
MAYSESQLALKAHIEALNKAHGMSVDTDLDYWAEHQITTVAQFEHDEAVTDYVETVKEDTGFKPRHLDFSKLSTQKIRNMTDAIRNREANLEKEAVERQKRNVIAPNRPFANLKGMMQQQ